ncbi:MAG: hypothetical protein KGM16_19940 [Bacteroidota bacterium]|nr:hypothetical protein [Bacteroidota bacterium]
MMINKKILNFSLSFLLTSYLILNSLVSIGQDKVFQYENDSVLFILKSFLKHDLQLETNDFFVMIDGITSKYSYPFQDKKINLITGIYQVRTGVSHSPQYLIIKDNKTFRIVTNYSMKNLKEECLKFFKNYSFSCNIKLMCLEDIIDIYNNRIKLFKSQNE